MTDSESINLANRVFQHNALTLETVEKIQIMNPETGKMMNLNLPSFGSVMSNLPFVPFEIIPDDDKTIINQIPLAEKLDGRSDLYCYIAAKIADVLKPGGMLGIIAVSYTHLNLGRLFIMAKNLKLPNSYGSVSKMSSASRRRKPYMVRITTGYVIDEQNGKAKQTLSLIHI